MKFKSRSCYEFVGSFQLPSPSKLSIIIHHNVHNSTTWKEHHVKQRNDFSKSLHSQINHTISTYALHNYWIDHHAQKKNNLKPLQPTNLFTLWLVTRAHSPLLTRSSSTEYDWSLDIEHACREGITLLGKQISWNMIAFFTSTLVIPSVFSP